MKGWLALTLGLLALVSGALWTLQGLGYVGGSVMTGQRLWAVVGPIVGLAGLGLLRFGVRRRERHRLPTRPPGESPAPEAGVSGMDRARSAPVPDGSAGGASPSPADTPEQAGQASAG